MGLCLDPVERAPSWRLCRQISYEEEEEEAVANDASDQRITSAVHRHFNNMLELLPSGTDRVGIIISLSLVNHLLDHLFTNNYTFGL